jgi:hypothetical protein
MATKIETRGWGNVKAVAAYAGVSERTVEDWLKNGLRYTQLPSGYRLIKFDWIDEYLETFATNAGAAKKNLDHIVDEVFSRVTTH